MIELDMWDVGEVLLDDGWHRCDSGFEVGPVQFGEPRLRAVVLPDGGVGRDARKMTFGSSDLAKDLYGVSLGVWFRFRDERDRTFVGPLSSVRALRCGPDDPDDADAAAFKEAVPQGA